MVDGKGNIYHLDFDRMFSAQRWFHRYENDMFRKKFIEEYNRAYNVLKYLDYWSDKKQKENGITNQHQRPNPNKNKHMNGSAVLDNLLRINSNTSVSCRALDTVGEFSHITDGELLQLTNQAKVVLVPFFQRMLPEGQ